MAERYAVNTTVSVERSQQEVTGILRKYGADSFGTMENKEAAFLMFEYKNLRIQMKVKLPMLTDFSRTETGRTRKRESAEDARSQAIKQRWRALVLAVKAKLEAVEIGISTVEEEFMAFVVMPDGRSFGDYVVPHLKEISQTGKMPKMLAAPL